MPAEKLLVFSDQGLMLLPCVVSFPTDKYFLAFYYGSFNLASNLPQKWLCYSFMKVMIVLFSVLQVWGEMTSQAVWGFFFHKHFMLPLLTVSVFPKGGCVTLPPSAVRVGDTSPRIRCNSASWLQKGKGSLSRAKNQTGAWIIFVYLALWLSEAFFFP